MSDFLNNIKTGLVHSEEIIVSSENTASKFGSGAAEVFATPAMIGLMESAAMKCVSELLPKGNITLGTSINIRHIKATPVGMKVRCEAKLIEIDGKKLLFELAAWDEEAQIGAGVHGRHIVEKEKFMERLMKGQIK